MKPKDWTGIKIHKLTFIRPCRDKKKHGNIPWEALCECGKTIYTIPSRVSGGNTTSCGCYKRKTCAKHLKHTRLYDPVITSARRVWSSYKNKDNNMCCFEEFFRLSQEPCYYCGRDPYTVSNAASTTNYNRDDGYQSTHGNFIYNGIDRVDTSKYHTIDNIVTCCIECNQAKNDLSLINFYKLIDKIYHHRVKGVIYSSCMP